MTNTNNPTIEQVRDDWRVLDTPDFVIPEGVRLISHENFTSIPDLTVQYIPPNWLARIFRKINVLYCFFYSLQLLFACKKQTVLIMNGGGGLLWLLVGYLHKLFFFRKTNILLWDLFVEYRLGTEKRLKFFPFIKMKTAWKESIARLALMEYHLSVLWSRKQIEPHANIFRLPQEKFIFLPFKADHSKWQTYDIPMNNFIFAGGNSKRDFQCLVEAVRGTGIPVIISTTDPKNKKQISHEIRIPVGSLPNENNDSLTTHDPSSVSNVIVLAASEPAFAQLQASCRFIVMPTLYSGLKGTSEANFCNAGWHRKPIIACCSIAAEDYIVEGETGYVLPSGDSEGLRKRILELWNDPEKVRSMGQKGREHIEKYFTHFQFVRRLLRLALLLGESKCNENTTNITANITAETELLNTF